MTDVQTASDVEIPAVGSTMLARQLRTGLAVERTLASGGEPYLYAEFQGPDYASRQPSVTTLLFTTHALSDVILHLMRGGVSAFGPTWAHLMSSAFTESVTGCATSGPSGQSDVGSDPPVGQYL